MCLLLQLKFHVFNCSLILTECIKQTCYFIRNLHFTSLNGKPTVLLSKDIVEHTDTSTRVVIFTPIVQFLFQFFKILFSFFPDTPKVSPGDTRFTFQTKPLISCGSTFQLDICYKSLNLHSDSIFEALLGVTSVYLLCKFCLQILNY
jgi:hypothetical protein